MISKQTTLDLNGPNISFTTQPQSITINNSGSAQFVGISTATFPVQTPPNPAIGTGSIVYRWYESSFGVLSDGSNSTLQGTISGSGTTTLTISGATKNGLGFYVVADYAPSAYGLPGVEINAGTARSTGNATNEPALSNTATLTVRPIISVTQNPSSVEVAENDLANFSAQGVSNDGTPISYRWQLNGNDLSDSGNISGTGTPNLRIRSSNISDNTVRARISHPTASNSPIFTNSANFKVLPARAIIGIEQYLSPTLLPIYPNRLFSNFSTHNLLNGPFSYSERGIQYGPITVVYASERDIRVRITMAGGSGGSPNPNVYSGLGGLSIFDYTFEKNVEYVFLIGHPVIDFMQDFGSPAVYSNPPVDPTENNQIGPGGGTFLYRKSRLVAAVGGGGGAYSTGTTRFRAGGAGGGINMVGEPSDIGRDNLTSPGGRYIPPGTFLQGRLSSNRRDGEISSCSNGTVAINASGIPACQDFPGLTQFRPSTNPNTTDSRSAFLFRGFKAGYPDAFRYNGAGSAPLELAAGGSGAAAGSSGFPGGGGGSGYSDGSISLISSILGGNTPQAQYEAGVSPPPMPLSARDYDKSGFIVIRAI